MDRQTTNRAKRQASPRKSCKERLHCLKKGFFSMSLFLCLIYTTDSSKHSYLFGATRTDAVCSLLHCKVLWLEQKCPPQAHVVEYLVSSRWCCLGRQMAGIVGTCSCFEVLYPRPVCCTHTYRCSVTSQLPAQPQCFPHHDALSLWNLKSK